MKVAVKNLKGEQVSEVDLPESIFGAKVSIPLMHQALLRQLANAHLGTHDTQTRSEVSKTKKKFKRQKGTGGARQGMVNAPHWKGGGVAFGPHPHSYEQSMPKKMRRLALKSALSAKAQANQIVVLQDFGLSTPKTREMAALIKTIANPRSTLIILPQGDNTIVARSADNLPGVKTLRHDYLNVRDLLGYDTLVLPVEAVAQIEQHYFKDLGLAAPTQTSAPTTPAVSPAPSVAPAESSAPTGLGTTASAGGDLGADLGTTLGSSLASDFDTSSSAATGLDADDAPATGK